MTLPTWLIEYGAVGIEADDDRIELFMSQVKDKDITELIAAGREKLASVPAGGGVAVAVAATGGAGGAAPAAAEFKKEEKVEQQEESDEVLFLSFQFIYIEFSFFVQYLVFYVKLLGYQLSHTWWPQLLIRHNAQLSSLIFSCLCVPFYSCILIF